MSKPLTGLMAKLAALPVEVPMPTQMSAPRHVEHAVTEETTAFMRERRGFIPEDMVAAVCATMLGLRNHDAWQFNSTLTALVPRH